MKSEKFLAPLDKIAEWALYIIIFTLPFSKSIVEVFIAVGIFSLLVRKIILRERFFPNTYVEITLYIFVAASLISIFNTQHSQLGLSARAFFSKTLKFAALFLIAKEIINTREKLTNFVIMAALSCFIILVDCFVQYYITHVDFLHNYTSFLYSPDRPSVRGVPTASFPFQNDFASWIVVFIFPALCLAIFAKRNFLKTAFAISNFIGLAYALVLTKVKGAWIGCVVSFLILSIIKLKKVAWGVLFVAVLATLYINSARISDAVFTVSLKDRSVMWKNSMTIFMHHPIIGNGLNTFYDNYMKVRQDDMRNKHGSYAHNCYLQMAAETGLVGLAAFLAFVTALLLKGFRSLRGIKDSFYYSIVLGAGLGLVAFLVHSAGDTNLYSLPLAALFWLSAGILMATVKIAESNS